MENPATWGEAEHVVDSAFKDWWANREKGCVGLSLARRVTDALREAGLLKEEAHPYCTEHDQPQEWCEKGYRT